MKIAIIGTRGIPNNYGGFEQLAEFLSAGLVRLGHEVTVYNSSLHPYKESTYKGVSLIICKDPENKIGTAGQFLYDMNCILDCRKRDYDAILQLGYTSSSIWSFLFPRKARIVTNMDGLEWKRSKYSSTVKRFLKYAEKLAVKNSHVLIADSLAIKTYLKEKYNKEAVYISYGAEIPSLYEEAILQKFKLVKDGYFLVIARMEPENNIEVIIKGYLQSKHEKPLIITGNINNNFGCYLSSTYSSDKVRFIGAVYDLYILNQLRHYCSLYFHGHSVGGTNPSLLEAMASGALICAHRNDFNAAVLGPDAYYFSDEMEVAKIMNTEVEEKKVTAWKEDNLEKIAANHSWEKIINAYNTVLTGNG